jgi:hypothetical protein
VGDAAALRAPAEDGPHEARAAREFLRRIDRLDRMRMQPRRTNGDRNQNQRRTREAMKHNLIHRKRDTASFATKMRRVARSAGRTGLRFRRDRFQGSRWWAIQLPLTEPRSPSRFRLVAASSTINPPMMPAPANQTTTYMTASLVPSTAWNGSALYACAAASREECARGRGRH